MFSGTTGIRPARIGDVVSIPESTGVASRTYAGVAKHGQRRLRGAKSLGVRQCRTCVRTLRQIERLVLRPGHILSVNHLRQVTC